MDGMNLPASFNNLTQMDKVQQDRHQLPIVNQEQNAEIAKKLAEHRLEKANEVDETEGKIIDPRKRREEQRKKREQQKRKNKSKKPPHTMGGNGHFVDFSV